MTHTIIGLAAGLGSILATWLILFLASCGIGLTFRRTFHAGAMDAVSILFAFWGGLLFTSMFLQLWHLVLPIRWPALVLVLLAGALGLHQHRGLLARWLRTASRHRGLLAALALSAVWVANRAMGPCAAYDSGLYHIPQIEWAKAYPVIPGLGNLHGRLAFNQGSLLYAAMVDAGPWSGRANHVVNGLFLLVLLAQIVLRLFQLPQTSGGQRGWCVFDVALLAPVVMMVQDPRYVSSYTIDVPAGVSVFVGLSILFGWLVASPGERAPAESRYQLVLAIGLFALAASFKLTVAVLGLLASLLGLLILVRHERALGRSALGPVAVAVVLCAGIGVPWVARSIVLSGYPFYPAALAPAPVDWRVPDAQVKAEAAWSISFARSWYSGQRKGPLGQEWTPDRRWWLVGWVERLWTHPSGRLMVALPSVVMVLLLPLLWTQRRRPGSTFLSRGWWLLAPLVPATLVWLVQAPRPVYGFTMLWALAAVCAAAAASSLRRHATPALVALLGLGLGAVPIVDGILSSWPRTSRNPLAVLASELIVRPGPDAWFHPTASEAVETFVTDSGLRLFVPARTNRCFSAPLPCTPYPAPNLRLRRDGLGSGFSTDGSWRPLNWPYVGYTSDRVDRPSSLRAHGPVPATAIPLTAASSVQYSGGRVGV